ncbi:MAG: hypothetical protein CMJ58_14395 [Planctomycetaceae bacterium]|nr:hypothetical protein [Planctomycetaceae bacterium]
MNQGLMRPVATWALWRMAAAAALIALTAVVASAQYCTPDQCDECSLCDTHLSCCHEPPELWLVNTRCLPRCSNLDEAFERISIKRWDPATRCFVKESVDSLIAQEANMPTLFFAHGNTLKHKGAMKQCWQLYNKFRCCPGKKRLVFWSWPAQIVYKRPLLRPRELILKNLRIKFVYSEHQGYYMAKILERMSFTQRVTAGGHSYGAIIAASAAHYLGGGELRGRVLAGGMPVERPNFRVMNISGAFDNDAMDPGKRYGQSFVAAAKVLNTRNATDKTLDNWPRVSYRGRRAIGVTGINANVLGEYSPKLCQITMTRDVGRSHYIEEHLASRKLTNLMCCFAFPECAACAMAIQDGTAPAPETAADLPVPRMPGQFAAGNSDRRELALDAAYAGDDDGPVLRLLRRGR